MKQYLINFTQKVELITNQEKIFNTKIICQCNSEEQAINLIKLNFEFFKEIISIEEINTNQEMLILHYKQIKGDS